MAKQAAGQARTEASLAEDVLLLVDVPEPEITALTRISNANTKTAA
jgi:hypothetical protein